MNRVLWLLVATLPCLMMAAPSSAQEGYSPASEGTAPTPPDSSMWPAPNIRSLASQSMPSTVTILEANDGDTAEGCLHHGKERVRYWRPPTWLQLLIGRKGLPVSRVSGSGFVIEANTHNPRIDALRESIGNALSNVDKVLVTNAHVVKDAVHVGIAWLADSGPQEAVGHVLARSELLDLALVGLPPELESAPALPIGDSDVVAPGDWVIAIGTPFGLDRSVTTGVVSGLPCPAFFHSGSEIPFRFLRSSVPAHPGNSGGPLINLHGELVGVVSGSIGSLFTASPVATMTVPSNTLALALPELLTGGHFNRSPEIGGRFHLVTADVAEAVGLGAARGALTTRVEPTSPAGRAGLQRGDIVLACDGQPVADERSLRLLIGDRLLAPALTLLVWRDGAAMDIVIDLAVDPPEEPEPQIFIWKDNGLLASRHMQ